MFGQVSCQLDCQTYARINSNTSRHDSRTFEGLSYDAPMTHYLITNNSNICIVLDSYKGFDKGYDPIRLYVYYMYVYYVILLY